MGRLAASLIGTWRVEVIGGSPVVDQSLATIVLGADGTLSGNASVNRMSGRWAAAGERIELSPGALTRMAGPPALMEQEQRYLACLERAASAEVRGARLVLRDADGAKVLVAARDGG